VIKHFLSASLTLLSLSANASLIDFTAAGVGNIPNAWNEGKDHADFTTDAAANFFNITFTEGKVGESITRLSFDLQAGSDDNALFDPSDGDKNSDLNGGGKGFGPIVGSLTDGLKASDATFSLSTSSGTSPMLSILFLAGSFSFGDTFSFGIDIDLLDGNLTDIGGGLLGLHSVGIQASISGSCESELATAFQKTNLNTSHAQLAFCSSSSTTSSVPLPNSGFLLILGLLALQQVKKQRRTTSITSALA